MKRMFKRSAALVLSLLLVLSCMSGIAFAANNKAVLEAEKTVLEKADEKTFTITLKLNNTSVSGLELTVAYDKEAFELSSYVGPANFMDFGRTEFEDGTKIGCLNMAANVALDTAYVFTFTEKEDIYNGFYNFSLSAFNATDLTASAVPFDMPTPVTVEVKNGKPAEKTTLALTKSSFQYTGNPISVAVKSMTADVNGTAVALAADDYVLSGDTSATAVGSTYKVTATPKEKKYQAASATWAITPADLRDVAVDSTMTVLNNNQKFALPTATATTVDGAAIKVEYALAEGSENLLTLNADNTVTGKGEEGTATVNVTVSAPNHTAVTKAVTVTVQNKIDVSKDLELDVKDYTAADEYAELGEGKAVSTYVDKLDSTGVTGVAGTPTVKYVLKKDGQQVAEYASYEALAAAKITAAGEYEVVATYEDTNNKGTVTAEFEIAKTKVAVPVAVDDLIYTGETLTGTTTVVGVEIEGNTAVDAGNYTATATPEANYMWEDGTSDSETISWTIARAKVEKVPEAVERTYNAAEQDGVEEVEGVVVTNDKQTDAGSYTAYATPDKNHCWSDDTYVQKEIDWSIAKADGKNDLTDSIEVLYSKQNHAYAVNAAAKLNLPGAVTEVKVDAYSGVVTSATADGSNVNFVIEEMEAFDETKTGTIRIKFTTANYEESTLVLTVGLMNKEPIAASKFSFTGKNEVTYDGTAKTYEAKVDHTPVGTATITYAYTLNDTPVSEMKDAGTYKVTATYEDDLYIGTSEEATFIINKAKITGKPEVLTPIEEDEQTLAAAELGIGTLKPAGGTVAWDDPADTVVEANKAYGWTYTIPAEIAKNYESNTLTGTAVPYPVSTGIESNINIKAGSTKYGSVSINPLDAEKGDKVVVTVKPKTGYEVDEVTVTTSKGKDVAVKSAGSNKYVFVMPAGQVTLEVTYKKADVVKFLDVADNAWYNEAVYAAVDMGLFTGVSENYFQPDGSMTRAMLVTVLWRLEGSPAAGSADFADVANGSWYDKAVAWANEEGIVTGISDASFAPNAAITREQMATMLYRYAKYLGLNTAAKADLSDYADADKISAYAVDAMAWAVRAGLINGVTADTLAPAGTATRAQVATILVRFVEKFL